jgi:hypothetical protein
MILLIGKVLSKKSDGSRWIVMRREDSVVGETIWTVGALALDRSPMHGTGEWVSGNFWEAPPPAFDSPGLSMLASAELLKRAYDKIDLLKSAAGADRGWGEYEL